LVDREDARMAFEKEMRVQTLENYLHEIREGDKERKARKKEGLGWEELSRDSRPRKSREGTPWLRVFVAKRGQRSLLLSEDPNSDGTLYIGI